MKKIISITGHPNSGHEQIAYDLSKNSAIEFVKPFTDKPVTDALLPNFHFVSKERLDELIESENVINETTINGNRYVFFECQLIGTYNVLILDDYAVADIQSKYNKYLYSIKVQSKHQGDSDRVGVYLYNHEFNQVFDYDIDDFDELECRIEEYYMNNIDIDGEYYE